MATLLEQDPRLPLAMASHFPYIAMAGQGPLTQLMISATGRNQLASISINMQQYMIAKLLRLALINLIRSNRELRVDVEHIRPFQG